MGSCLRSGEKRYILQHLSIEGISNFRVSTHCRLLLFFQRIDQEAALYSPCVEDGIILYLENINLFEGLECCIAYICTVCLSVS